MNQQPTSPNDAASAAEAAALWWSHAVVEPGVDCEGKGAVLIAALISRDPKNKQPTEQQLETFKSCLVAILNKDLSGTVSDGYGVALSVNFHPSTRLKQAAADAGLDLYPTACTSQPATMVVYKTKVTLTRGQTPEPPQTIWPSPPAEVAA